ncbi:NADH:ubiquinone oxidoreductase [Neoehrlichia mikurensis]|uniref:NADH-ubiquinone oxidoreductase subunit NDUFA12 family protein n=1 Tax=Neoehrlichia mikurensis TaxID=89586 RepID=A0A9Q9BRZ0_9RICK|nr:NADH-ubiquinone oxidoreductase subunit NDUFA12 family protein [Neoehrlichia mikurensis]QXK92219.1 NADH:ubiquinone oxidoreductase [Neoehrlichia mikurensis]QXK92674.1 NADH:ubiquinone oxidoreductase [Neoehrlichia mikurensis]QXK93912.1 NADH:ubiquinone oxidoreductase [Neoehrlichia mikurensis]UTO55087.1 NADH-ubiquinone oxidoreductase subunit NDUFA12 family protein [Neoehrlichia mikurensis]UTO56006.1 NADH-ubiquinone oxidoreductase subunit NDUFA12 family protein [Neoehrlichia mikurensis]
MLFFTKLKFFFKRNKQFVGTDEFGNRYYKFMVNNIEKRLVLYNKKADPTTIPARWHIWLHYTDSKIPQSLSTYKNKHCPNLTGTKHAYHPHFFNI